MRERNYRLSGPAAMDLIEEAVHLLRSAPTRALAAYYMGSVPFVLGLLYFWADMTRSAFARDHCGSAAWAMVGLFIWMKTWQSVFARMMRAAMLGEAESPLSLRRWCRTAVSQAIIQSTGTLLLPVAGLATLPFGWAYAYYQNATVLDDGEENTHGELTKKAAKLAAQWPAQNHLLLGTVAIGLFFIFLNLAVALINIPSLLHSLLGIETTFSMSMMSLFNSTFVAALCGMSYLVVDPLVKTVYCLRCFYGESVNTGADLQVALRRASLKRAGALLALCMLLLPGFAQAADAPAKVEKPVVESQKLDRAIEEVLAQREYAWRLPRERVTEDHGPVAEFLNSIAEWFRSVGNAIKRVIREVYLWIERFFEREPKQHNDSGGGEAWMWSMRIMVFILLVVCGCALALFIHRWWKRQPKPEPIVAEAVAVPDLRDENLTANQLPEDEWLKLARQMLERGELRLALRAYYLASLAHLGQRELIEIARFKSNREYEIEVRRRGRPFPDLVQAFAANVLTFDRVWYGTHEVSGELLTQFKGNLERIRAC